MNIGKALKSSSGNDNNEKHSVMELLIMKIQFSAIFKIKFKK